MELTKQEIMAIIGEQMLQIVAMNKELVKQANEIKELNEKLNEVRAG